LQKRYHTLVAEHCGQGRSTAPGPRLLPALSTSLAATQAAWRFYHNYNLNPKLLAQPLRDAAADLVPTHCHDWVLAVHDWSDLDFRTHTSKHDRMVLGQKEEIGYELHSCLLLSDRGGEPLAPVYQAIKSERGLTSSRQVHTNPWPASRTNLDALSGTMSYVRRLKLGRPAVHIIDAEADSIFHFRAWHKAGHHFVVRVKGKRHVRHQGQVRSLNEAVTQLRKEQAFTFSRAVCYHGRTAQQFVAQTAVVLHRAAKLERKEDGGKRRLIKGRPLPLRLVVSEVRDDQGQVLAVWLLLTNVPVAVPSATIVLWYYWRWRTEGYYKLLKAAGQQVEHWQQETVEALCKRLLVASMACVLTWQVALQPGVEGEMLRELLVRLSGRVLKRGQQWTLPALLAGVWVLLASLRILEHYSVERLRQLAQGIPLGEVLKRSAQGSNDHPETHGPSP
jgi:hypothetical protein